MNIKYIFALFLYFFAAGCGSEPVDPLLPAADSLMNERPDSALYILQIADTLRWSDSEKARRRVLLSRAYNLTGAGPAGDSLIRPALNYYDRKGTDADKALAWYYYGSAHENAGDMEEAVKGYSTALHHAEKIKGDSVNDRLRATLYHTLGVLYSGQGYSGRAGEYFDWAARLLGTNTDRIYSLLMKSTVLYQEHRYGEAIAVLDSVREQAANSGDRYLAFFVDTYLLHYHVFAEDWPVDRLMEERNKLDRNTFLSLSADHNKGVSDQAPLQLYDIVSTIIFFRAGQADSAAYYVCRSLESLGTLSLGTVGMLRIAASIAKMQGNPDSAFYYERCYGMQLDSIYKAERSQQISELEQRYRNEYEIQLIRTRSRYQDWIFVLVGLLLLAVIGGVVVFFRQRLRRRDEELNEYLALIGSYRESHENLVSRLQTTDEREKAVKRLLEGRFAMIREIAATYYMYGETRRLTEKMKELALSPAMLSDVIRMTDIYNDNAVARLRRGFPGWTSRNYDFAALVIAGFSPQEISVMLDMTLNGVYTLKSKLKRRVAESESPDRSFFIHFFG